jgi:hypothetical protein
LWQGKALPLSLSYKIKIMTNEQFKAAVAEVKELVETNSEWVYDSSDAMDGYVFVTVCRPQTEEEKNS